MNVKEQKTLKIINTAGFLLSCFLLTVNLYDLFQNKINFSLYLMPLNIFNVINMAIRLDKLKTRTESLTINGEEI